MNNHAVYHIPDVPYAYALNKDELRILLRVAKDDIKECSLYYRCRYDFESPYKAVKMNLFEENHLFEIYSIDVSIFRNRYRYYFEITDNNGEIYYYDERGSKIKTEEEQEIVAFQYAYIGEADIYDESKWLQESVVYQIFPDRFCNGDESINPRNVKQWGGTVDHKALFGGDLRGIINKIDYLRELGITLLYLTPILKSPSNHKYNIDDYYMIDESFGDIETLKELVRTCHENNIKVILDGVFNHTGSGFFAFKDLLEKQEKSQYVDWYHIDKLPVSIKDINYYTFANKVANMPKLNTANKEVKKYFIDVAKYWIRETDIDGWRFDVCDEVDHQFWREMRIGIKEVKKEAVLVGEIMHESVSYLRGEQLDSIMNYPFKHAMIDFFAKRKINAQELNDILAINRYIYMESISKQLWNLIGSHDTHRFLTECDDDINRMILASVFQFTYLGLPYIYYGDEVGVNGGEDPQCRKCIPWNANNQNIEMLNHYKNLAKIRKENKALIHGNYRDIGSNDKILIFERNLEDEKIIVIINNDMHLNNISLNLEGTIYDLYNGREITVNGNIEIEPMNFKILKIK